MRSLFARTLDREGLLNSFVDTTKANLIKTDLAALLTERIPSRGGIIGKWQKNDDPLSEILIVNDEDLSETYAWLSSYFTGLAPITQWCRILPKSQFGLLADMDAPPNLSGRLGGWVGAILAECSAQASYGINLKDLPGNAALTSATFAAARAIAIWGTTVDLRDLASRHEELGARLREGHRPISAIRLLPIWLTLNPDQLRVSKSGDWRALEPFAMLFDRIASARNGSDGPAEIANIAMEHFKLSALLDCSRGPQLERVRALDILAQTMTKGPRSDLNEAILGFAASLVDPGAAVLPELLRKYLPAFPLAPCWLGAFAGCWSTTRVLTDHQGLGRLVAKMLLAETDLGGKPQCDIAYDEISRWIAGVIASRLPIRGMTARSLSVELLLGVVCPFAVGRGEVQRVESSGSPARRDDVPPLSEPSRGRNFDQMAFLARSLDTLTRRVEAVERFMSSEAELIRKIRMESSQQDLLRDLDAPDTNRSPKKKR